MLRVHALVPHPPTAAMDEQHTGKIFVLALRFSDVHVQVDVTAATVDHVRREHNFRSGRFGAGCRCCCRFFGKIERGKQDGQGKEAKWSDHGSRFHVVNEMQIKEPVYLNRRKSRTGTNRPTGRMFELGQIDADSRYTKVRNTLDADGVRQAVSGPLSAEMTLMNCVLFSKRNGSNRNWRSRRGRTVNRYPPREHRVQSFRNG